MAATLLEAWGHRLGVHKSEFGKSLDGDWSTYTPEMLEYCTQDVVVSVAVAGMFQPKLEVYKDCIETEHKIAEIMAWQEECGFPFDVDKAHQLESKLRTELDALSDEMRETFLFVDGGLLHPQAEKLYSGLPRGCCNVQTQTVQPYQSRPHRMGFRNLQRLDR